METIRDLLKSSSLGLNTDKNLLSGDQKEFSQLCLARVALPVADIRLYHKNKELQNWEIISPTVPVESLKNQWTLQPSDPHPQLGWSWLSQTGLTSQ